MRAVLPLLVLGLAALLFYASGSLAQSSILTEEAVRAARNIPVQRLLASAPVVFSENVDGLNALKQDRRASLLGISGIVRYQACLLKGDRRAGARCTAIYRLSADKPLSRCITFPQAQAHLSRVGWTLSAPPGQPATVNSYVDFEGDTLVLGATAEGCIDLVQLTFLPMQDKPEPGPPMRLPANLPPPPAAPKFDLQRPDVPLTAIGKPFAPETPRAVQPGHPFYRRIDVAPIEGLPANLHSSKLYMSPAAPREEVEKGLQDSLRYMNLLAPDASYAYARLHVTWVGSDVPFNLGGRNTGKATLHYRLVRTDTGQVLFDRDIVTSVNGAGAAAVRDNGILRAAIATNFASAARCFDRLAVGQALADCALTPKFTVAVETRRTF